MATVETTEETKSAIRVSLPDWMRTEPGFQFLDESGDLNIVLGWGGWRDAESLGSLQLYQNEEHEAIVEALYTLKFKPPTLVIAYRYKGEWHLRSAGGMNWDGCRPA